MLEEEEQSYKNFILRANMLIGPYVGVVAGFLFGPLFLGNSPLYQGDEVLREALMGAVAGGILGVFYAGCVAFVTNKPDADEEPSAH